MKKTNLLSNIITFAAHVLIVNFALNYFFNPENPDDTSKKGEITLLTTRKEFNQGDLVDAEIQNNSNQLITLANECPGEPLDVFISNKNDWNQKSNKTLISCEGTQDIKIEPGGKYTFNCSSWNHALFGEIGKYKLRASVLLNPTAIETQQNQNSNQPPAGVQPKNNTQNVSAFVRQQPDNPPSNRKTIESPEFEIKPQGFFSSLWTTVFYQPLYNVLIYLISIAPGKDLGLAIILLTIIIRTILLIPSQNALKSQRKMQEVQPKLNKIKEKYKNNQEMIAKETMAILKENKANPLGACLPLLIQLPILLALFYVVQGGLNPDNSYLLYSFLKTFSFQNINVHFLNLLDLTKVNHYVLPLIVGGLQFLQMKLATFNNKEKQTDQKNESAKKAPKNEMEIATSTMMYIMPVMIAFLTSQAPAGVGLYWSISTLYGIGQQLVVNHQSKRSKTKIKVLPPSAT